MTLRTLIMQKKSWNEQKKKTEQFDDLQKINYFYH